MTSENFEAENIEKILDGEFQALRSLESLIEEEYQCLRTFDSEEQLIEIAEKKQALLTSLEKQAKKRKEAQLSHFTTTKSASGHTNMPDSYGINHEKWSGYIDLLRVNRKKNIRNGIMINMSQNNLNNLLACFTGGDGNRTVNYGPDGKAEKHIISRTIDRA